MNFVLDRPLRLMPLHEKFSPILDQIFSRYGESILVREFLDISIQEEADRTRLGAALNLYFYQIRWALQKMSVIWDEISPVENSKIYTTISRAPRKYSRLFSIVQKVYGVETFADILLSDQVEYSRKYAADRYATAQLLEWREEILKGNLEDNEVKDHHFKASRGGSKRVKEKICLDELSPGEIWNYVYRKQPARVRNFLWRTSTDSPEEFLCLKRSVVLADRCMGKVSWRQIHAAQQLLKPFFLKKYNTPSSVWDDGVFLLEHWKIVFDSLHPRVKNTLKTLSVKSPEQLLRLTEKGRLSERGVGKKTWNEIVCLQDRIRELYFSGAESFSDTTLCIPINLNAEESLSILPLSERGKTILDRLGVKTLGQLLLTTEKMMLAQKRCGKTTVNDVRQNLREYLSYVHTSAPLDVGVSFADLMHKLCLDTKHSKYEWIVIARICRGETLESIGQRSGCSRERVRQIIVMVSESIQQHFKTSQTLCFVKNQITEILLENNGALSPETLVNTLSHRFGWLAKSTHSRHLKRVFDFFPFLGEEILFSDLGVQLRYEQQ